MSRGANLENTSLGWVDQITKTTNGTVARNNRVLASSAERLVGELSGVYGKIQSKDRGQYEAQQLYSRLQNMNPLLDAATQKKLGEMMDRDLQKAEGLGKNSARDLSAILSGASDTLKNTAKPNVPAMNAAGQRLNDFWAKENTLFKDRVTAMTQAAAAEGKSWRNLAQNVRELLLLEKQAGTESTRSQRVNARLGIAARSELIARTEMQTAYVRGQIDQFREQGYDWVRWSAAAERSCQFCLSRDGLVYMMEDVESSIPAHPRCRCSLIPVDAPAGGGKGQRGRRGDDAEGGRGDDFIDGIDAAESMDDAYWAKSRNDKLQEYLKDHPKTTPDDLIRYAQTPTNTQNYLNPGQPAPEPVWAPSGSLYPNLSEAVLNANKAAKRVTDRELIDQLKAEAEAIGVNERPDAQQSYQRHSDAAGSEPDQTTQWTSDRQQLHNEIVEHFLRNGVAQDNPTFYMSGGGPASGKGFMLAAEGFTVKNGNETAPRDGLVLIDADEIKKMLPEYRDMQKQGGKVAEAAAGYVHEESSYLTKRIMDEAAARRYDTVLDGTGDNGIKSLTKKVQKMKDLGYRVEAKYVSADTATAVDRNWERYLKTGRLPPEGMLRNVHADISETLPRAIEDGLFDKVELYDTNKSGELRKVLHTEEGGRLIVDDQELYDNFLRKARPEEQAEAKQSYQRYSNSDGAEPGRDTTWTAEREKLHLEIIEKFLKAGVPSENPTFYMSGGGPASGKGYMLAAEGFTVKNGGDTVPRDGLVLIDADEIKRMLPDYVEMQKKGGKEAEAAAGYVHEESSYLAKRIMDESAKRKFDTVLDGTGDNGIKSLTKKVQKMKEMGYRVEAKYVTVDTATAVDRNWERYLKTGRLPPEGMLRNVHADISQTLPDAIESGLFDKVELFDTNKSGGMRKVLHTDDNGKLVVDDQELYDNFLNKARPGENPDAKQSYQRYSNEGGEEPGRDTTWTKDREKLHLEIIEKALKEGLASENPTFYMTGGGPASGKGYMLKEIDLPEGTVKIDADEIKKLLPDYVAMQKKGGKEAEAAAGYVHEESSYLAKRIMDEAAKRSFNTMLDGTGDNGIKSLAKKVEKMRAQGYRVEAKYVTVDTAEAVDRNWKRFLKTGRLPPEGMLRKVHADISKTLPDAIDQKLFDSVELYDTNQTGTLRKVAHTDKNGGLVVDSDQLWDNFLRKAYPDERPDAEYSYLRHSNTDGAEPGRDTTWTAEREKLHMKIIDDFLKKGVPRETPTFYMTGGGPASGKGGMLKSMNLPDGTVIIDADEIKKLLPEYVAMQKKGGKEAEAAAGYVHEESSYLTKRIMDEAAKRKFDTVLDGTGDNGVKSLAKKVQKMKDLGYRVEAKYVTVDTETAATRNWERYLKTGRLPPEQMLRNVHRDISQTLPDAIDQKLFDNVELYDTNKSGELRKVLHTDTNGKLVVDNDELYSRFLSKADAPVATEQSVEAGLDVRRRTEAQDRQRLQDEAASKKAAKEAADAGGDPEARARATKELQVAEQKLLELEQKQQKVADELERAQSDLDGIKTKREAAETKLAQAEASRDALAKKLGTEQKFLESVRDYLAGLESEAVGLDAQIKRLDSELSQTGATPAQVKAYNRQLAEATHSLDSIKQLGKDVLKAAGVDNVKSIAEWTEDARLLQLRSSQEDLRIAQSHLRDANRLLFNATDPGSRELYEWNKVGAQREVNEESARITRIKKRLADDPPNKGTTDPAEAVLDYLRSSSPLTQAQAEKLVKQVSSAKALKQGGAVVMFTPAKSSLGPVTDAVQMYGNRLSMDRYGKVSYLDENGQLAGDRAYAVRRGRTVIDGVEYKGNDGQVNQGFEESWTFRKTQFHELAHHVEYTQADVYSAAHDFIMDRSNGQPSKHLGYGYGSQEYAFEGKAIDPYVLKDYRRALRENNPELGKSLDADPKQWAYEAATEVISMGMEKLASGKDLRGLAIDDPGHFLLSIGAARLTQARAFQVDSAKGESVNFGPDKMGTAIDGGQLPKLKGGLTAERRAQLEGEAEIARKRLAALDKDLPGDRKTVADVEADYAAIEAELNATAGDLAANSALRNELLGAKGDERSWGDYERKLKTDLDAADKATQDQAAVTEKLRQGLNDIAPAKKPAALPDSEAMRDQVGRLTTDEIYADPERFQYKLNANKTTGEVGSLRGVEAWNEDLAGVLSVWKDPADGRTYVINGHNRLGLAKRLGAKELPVLFINAQSAAEARAIGAKQNMANGDGTAVDAAKFMRDTGRNAQAIRDEGLNLKGSIARDGSGLAELPDFMFQAVVEGRLSVEHGSTIGRSGLSTGQMADAYRVLQERPNMSISTLDEVLLAARASKSRVREEQTLFGTDTVETSTMVERAELAAKLRADQGREVRVLERAAGQADVLATRGNVIDVQQAQVRSAEARGRADVFDLLKNRPDSKVAKALNDAAAAIQDAPNRSAKAKATKEGSEAVNRAIDAEIERMVLSPEGALRSIADLRAKRDGEINNPPELELAVQPRDMTLDRIPTRLLDPATAKVGQIGSLRPDQLLVDAERFQYKATSNAKTGEVGSLEGVSKWDPNLGGVLAVWRDPSNGQSYVINGHNRLALAKRLGAEAVSVRYIDAPDAKSARAMGALANIAEGQGTAIDAAKFMRDMNLTDRDLKNMGVPLKKAVAKDGAALSNLPDDLWGLVVQERLSIDKAAEIGSSGLDADAMKKIADVLSKRPNASLGTVKELVASERAAMDNGTTLSLFGDTTSARFQLDRAQLTRSVRDDLLGDKRLFGTLATSRAASTLASAGSTVNISGNKQASAEADRILAIFDQLKNVSGPVSEALNRGAGQLERTKSAADRQKIKRQVRLDVIEAVAQELRGLPTDAPEPPPEAPGQESLFG